jgi:hypothetical protein
MQMFFSAAAFTLLAAGAIHAGTLTLEIGKPEANTEAKNMHATLVARVTSCHEPARSVVTATLVRSLDGELQRTPLKVTPLSSEGFFAVTGADASEGPAVIEMAVTNPQFQNYKPHVLVPVSTGGVQWDSVKRFSGDAAPTPEDLKAALAMQRSARNKS